jgi:hypothetical protein
MTTDDSAPEDRPARRLLAAPTTWTRSYEEDFDERIVYRPATFPFPPGRRPRTSLQLEHSGRFVHLGIPAPADRRTASIGSWDLDGNTLALQLKGQPVQRFQIENMDEQRLVLRRIQ